MLGLALLVTGASACSTPAASAPSGIEARALLSPTCPAQRAGQSCARAYVTTLVVYRATNHQRITTVRTGHGGRFRVALPPGRYTIEGSGTGLPHASAVAVLVKSHQFARVTIAFDTGIR